MTFRGQGTAFKEWGMWRCDACKATILFLISFKQRTSKSGRSTVKRFWAPVFLLLAFLSLPLQAARVPVTGRILDPEESRPPVSRWP